MVFSLAISRRLAGLLLLLGLCAVAPLAAAQTDAPITESQYRLGPGDVLRIQVFGEADLSFDGIRLNDAGRFSYPFLGEISAQGRTASQIEQSLIEGLKGDYLIDPRVSVSILEYRDFYVNGEVGSPGGYPFKPGLTVRKAVALAGGLTERASEGRISVIREDDPSRKPVKVELDDPVRPGDIITIDQGFF